MIIYIKNMVSIRCKMLVREELTKLGFQYFEVELGTVKLTESMSDQQQEQLKENLHKWGLEMLLDRKNILIEKIKNVVVEMVHFAEELPKVNYSDYISERLHHDYTYLSNVFSEARGMTIQQYIIKHKIERVKELLEYEELNLTEISYKMHYSSVSHLSNQFKKVTGLCPSFYKQLKPKREGLLENL